MKTEHPDSARIIDAMIGRLHYLEVNADPWGGETRSILWQVFSAALLARNDKAMKKECPATHCSGVVEDDRCSNVGCRFSGVRGALLLNARLHGLPGDTHHPVKKPLRRPWRPCHGCQNVLVGGYGICSDCVTNIRSGA